MKANPTPSIACLFLLIFFSTHSIAQVTNVGSRKFSIEVNGNTLKIPYYSNLNLFTADSDVTKAVVVVHGSNRNADDYYDNMVAAAGKVPDLTENMLIVAPQFLTETDIESFSLDAEHLYWTSGGWVAGSNSRDEDANPRPERIPSFEVMDSLLMHLAKQFPNLESIVFTGHSAGGQLTQRMAATSPITDLLCSTYQISVRFIVANPSSYVYMDNNRKVGNSTTQFAIPSTSCNDYNEWKYGLEDLFTYPRRAGVDSIRNMFERRRVTYLLGENDNNPNSSSLDTDCEANLQGAHRLERGTVFYNYLQFYYGNTITTNHTLSTVPNVGHSNFDMYNSSEGVAALFEDNSRSCGQLVNVYSEELKQSIHIFPNPTEDFITIESEVEEIRQLALFDLTGRLVESVSLSSGRYTLDLSTLESGIYLLQIKATAGSFCQKIIKR
ncbi:MAG: T9SS type A sorting domain-containing protein [Bacteroidota bacterium]